MKPKAKPRKPTNYKLNHNACRVDERFTEWPIVIYGNNYSLKSVKRLHKWLGKAISYLESREKK